MAPNLSKSNKHPNKNNTTKKAKPGFINRVKTMWKDLITERPPMTKKELNEVLKQLHIGGKRRTRKQRKY